MTVTKTETVTRIELGTCIRDAFGNGPATPTEIIATARAAGADTRILTALERLQRPSYRELRELWSELWDLPVGRGQG